MIEQYAASSAQQVKAFNASLPDQVKSAFQTKLDELTQQHSIFTGLGIVAEEPSKEIYPTNAATKKPKPKEPKVIIQYVTNQYNEHLNQTNNNTGNVNNAIQST